MKYYKTNNGISAIGEKGDIDGDQSKLVQKDWIEISYNEMLAITNPPLTEEQRIQQIKAKANELILAKYSIIWQLNHPRVDVQYKDDYDFIDNIRRISNEAEANGNALEDINWEVTNG